MLTKLLNLLISFTIFLNPIKPLYDNSTTSLSKPFNYIGYGDYSTIFNNYTIFNLYDEVSVDYIFVDDSTLSYTYMIYPLLFSSDSVEFKTIFVNFFAYDMANYLTSSGNIFELEMFAIDTFPFTSWANTLNWFKTIDNLSFDYYLPYDNNYLNGLVSGDCIYSYLSLDNAYINEGLSCCVMRFNKDYFSDFLIDTDFLTTNQYLYPFNPSYFSGVYTSYYNPQITFSELDISGAYSLGFTDGLNSVDTSYYYNNGFTDGVNSVNVNAIYQNGYSQGYNVGITESSGSYGITDLLYSVFDIPVIMLSNLLSFTIFGQDAWGLILSILFLGVILYLIRLFINGHKLQ